MNNENNELVIIDNNDIKLSDEAKTLLEEYFETKRKFDDTEKKLKQQLLEVMEANEIKSITNGNLTVTYIAETFVENFNKEAFKKENPELCKKYTKLVPKKAYVKISLKNNKNE